MTIKPIAAPSQKRVSTDAEKKDGHGGHAGHSGGQVATEQPNHGQQAGGGRTAAAHTSHRNVVIEGQSPQRRNDIFDEISRHRRSPYKNTRNKRRDHEHPHLKRDRSDRAALDKHCGVGVATSKCSSPRPLTVPAVVSSGGNTGGNSPGVGKSTEQIAAISSVLGCQSPKSQTAVTQAATNLLKAVEDTYSGYNSGDEHLQPKEALITVDEWQQRDEEFAKCMSGNGYIVKQVEEDGACLFRAISLQIYGDEEMHDVIRQHTMDYIYKNREYFSHFVTEDINSYIKRKRRMDSHGNHIEIQAMSEIYSRPVEVYCYKPTPINIFNSEQLNNGYAPLRLSYQRGSHYNAIIDPYNATVGVGLGLAEYKPEMQTKEAVRLSEQLEIEQTMFEDKLKTTDWEATNEAIEEQIARESYLQWCRENLQKSRSTAAATASASSSATTTSATVTSAEAASDAEASPSKYANMRCGGSNSSVPAAATCTGQTGGCFNAASTSASTSASSSMSTALAGLSAKSLMNLKKDAADTGFDSDDTDMSSTSSIGNCNSGNTSPTTAFTTRANKTKNRSSLLRGIKKRRREVNLTAPLAVMSASKEVKNSPGQTSPRRDGIPRAGTEVQEARAKSAEAEQRPSTSKQWRSPAEKPKDSSSPVRQTSVSSSLYQELLEASYAADGGLKQLTESEMLQRAIRMSTQDYIKDQKRKYFYGPSSN